MEERFLLEQIRRMRALSEQMGAVRTRAAEISEMRERELMRQHPLYQVRDFRIERSHDPLEGAEQRDPSTPRSARRRRRS
jgi:hypothetical protein